MITVIFPIYSFTEQSQEAILKLYQYLKNFYSSIEFILVDDGPKHQEKIRAFAHQHRFIYVRHEYKRGKGYAIQTGISISKGEVIVFTDADVPYRFQNLYDIIELICRNYDVAIADRTLQASRYYEYMPWYRNLASVLFSKMVRILVLHDLPDTQCGLKGFKSGVARSLFQYLSTSGYAFDVEILLKAKIAGYTIARIPVQLREQGKSFIHIFHVLQMVYDVMKIFFSVKLKFSKKFQI